MSWLSEFFGGGSNEYNPWLAAIAQNEAQAKIDAQNAAAAQAAANAAAAQTATAATPAAPAAAPAGPTFDPSPYQNIVNSSFSQFTPEWYANQYQAAYKPWETGVNTQYGTAKDYLTAGLAKKGQQNTPLATGLFQQLDALKGQNLTAGQTFAQNYQGGLESGVNTAKSGLLSSIGAGADNASIGTRAKAAADPIYGTKAPASTLGSNVFGSLVDPYATATNPEGPALSFGAKGDTGLSLAGGAGGPEASTKVVGGVAPTTKKKKF